MSSAHHKTEPLAFRPYLTWTLILIALVLNFVLASFDSSLYGINGSTSDLFSYSAAHPTKNSLLPFFTSPFLHAHLKHLFMNLLFLSIFSFLLERKIGPKALLFKVLAIHLLTLVFLSALTYFKFIDPKNYFGLSHIIFGLMAYWAALKKKKIFLIILFLYLGYTLLATQFNPEALGHALGFTVGFSLGILALRYKD